jgi:hypothetical protein
VQVAFDRHRTFGQNCAVEYSHRQILSSTAW